MNLNSHRRLLLAAAACSLAGCSFILSSDSHSTSNPKISHIRDRTAGVQAKAEQHQLSLADSEKFLHESLGVAELLRGMEGRGSDEERIAALNRYDTRLKSLLARRKPIRSADAVDLGANISELDSLYRLHRVRSTDDDDSSATSESITDSTTTCDTDKDKKEKDRKRDRDGHRDRDNKKRDRDHCEDDDKKRDHR